MEKIINNENFSSFAYTNEKLIKGRAKALVFDFYGLGTEVMADDNWGWAKKFAENDIIYCVPYYNPWSWMNDTAVRFTDEIAECIMNRHNKILPVISTGGSMGGLSSIVYANYSSHTPAGVVSNCPVCDLPFHYGERPDLPRTIYSAFGHYECGFEDAVKSASPYHLIGNLPKIPYRLFHCTGDKHVNIDKHSRKFVCAMKENGYDAELTVIEGRTHGDLGESGFAEYVQEIFNLINNL